MIYTYIVDREDHRGISLPLDPCPRFIYDYVTDDLNRISLFEGKKTLSPQSTEDGGWNFNPVRLNNSMFIPSWSLESVKNYSTTYGVNPVPSLFYTYQGEWRVGGKFDDNLPSGVTFLNKETVGRRIVLFDQQDNPFCR